MEIHASLAAALNAVVAIDQITKSMATQQRAGIMLPARNPAYALGVVTGSAPALILGAVVVLGVFLVLADGLVTRLGISALMPALIVGGMVGNTLDRIRIGAVRDFLVTPWAIINFADVAVALGIVGLLFALVARAPRVHHQLATARR